ncbi:MAG TPA: sugar phosphate isomerase/epimerase family protein [Actinospica sp.]|nr:sugar phosphate isomerase/epimerase family protein [Actinospica sp.]
MTTDDWTTPPRIGLLANQAFSGSPWKGVDAWRAAAEAGASWISVTEEAYELPAERVVEIREGAHAAGIPIEMTACHSFGLADPRDAVREFNLEWAKAHIDFTRELGASRMKILLGEWIWRGMWPNEMQWHLEADGLRKLCEYAERRDVRLSIEPEPLENSFINDPLTLRRMIDEVASPALFANVDTSHFAVRAVPAADLQLLTGLIDTIDFGDSNGRWHEHLAPGSGVADLAGFAAELVRNRHSPDAALAVEVGPFADPESAFTQVEASVARTAELFRDAAKQQAAA